MQTFQQYFYENKTILSHIMESRSGKWDIFIKFASSFEVLSFSIRFFAKFGRHFVSYLFGKPLAYRKRAARIVGDDNISTCGIISVDFNLRLINHLHIEVKHTSELSWVIDRSSCEALVKSVHFSVIAYLNGDFPPFQIRSSFGD